MTDPAPQRNPVEKLAEEFVERHRRGERPSLSEYTARYPELADEIRDLFPALVLMEQLKPASVDATGAYSGGGAAPTGKKLERLGDYRILREVGRGGMGIVYEAEQESLGRRVALKILPSQALLDPQQQKRFQREAKAAARLHHTNIVPVYGVGEHDGLHYYVMQFIQGLGLDEVLVELKRLHRIRHRPARTAVEASPTARNDRVSDVSAVEVAQALLTGEFAAQGLASRGRQPLEGAPSGVDTPGSPALDAPGSPSSVRLPGSSGQAGLSESGRHYWQSVARIGIQVADALEYAHGQGIVHRDIKPSNLLLDTQGTVWVTDFGLAKASTEGAALTNTGDIVGTLRYMAPERFQGYSDARGDVYSLGLTLYELLVQWPAFDETDRNKLIHQVTHEEPPRPRKLNAAVPRDLETVVLKAIERELGRRYQTAHALAEDLQRFLEDKPIRARRVSLRERYWRWCRRNPALAAVGGLATAALLAVTVLSVAFSVAQSRSTADLSRVNDSLREETAQTEKALADARTLAADLALQEKRARDALGESRLLSARLLVEQQQPRLGMLWLARALEMAPADAADLQLVARTNLSSLRGELPLLRLALPTQGSTPFGPFFATGAVFSPDGKVLLTAGADKTARLWDTATGKPAGPPLQHQEQVVAVDFSPDGKAVVTGSLDRTARLWDTASGRPLGPPLEHPQGVLAVGFGAAGKTILTACQDAKVRLWEAATGKPTGRIMEVPRVTLTAVGVSPDGKTIVTVHLTLVRFWDGATGEPVGELLRHPNLVLVAQFSPDGKTLVTSCLDKKVRLWDVATGKQKPRVLEHIDVVGPMEFRPDGKAVLTGTVGPITVDRRGGPVFRGSTIGTAQLWDTDTGKAIGPAMHHASGILSIAFSADNRLVLTGSLDGTAKLWEADTGRPIGQPLSHPAAVALARFSPDSRAILTMAQDKVVRLWDLPAGRLAQAPLTHLDPVRVAAFSPDGKTVVTATGSPPPDSRGAAQLWDADTGKPMGLPLHHSKPVTAVAFSPDGAWVATASLDSSARLWGARTGKPAGPPLQHGGPVSALTFSPDGKTLATASDDRTARLWDVRTGQPIGQPLRHRGPVAVLAFSPDGKTLATGSHDRTARLWEASTGTRLGQPMGHDGGVQAVVFSPDGQTLVTGSLDRTARLWNARTGQRVGQPLQHLTPVSWESFSRDGQTVLTAADNTVRQWDAATGKPIGQPLQHREAVTGVAVSPDGGMLVTGSRDGTARLWHAKTGQPLGPPLLHQGKVTTVAFSPDGRRILTASEDRTARLWETPAPLQGEPARLARWVEVSSGLELTAEDAVRLLDGPSWQDHRQNLEKLGGPPENSGAAAGADPGWDQRLAVEAAAAGNWFAARWHLDRLIKAQPNDWFAHALRGKAHVKLEELDQAANDCAQALRMGPASRVRDWFARQSPDFEADSSWTTARWYLDQLIQARPQDGLAHALRTRVHVQLGQLQEAGADYSWALALGPREDVLASLDGYCHECETREQWQTALWYLDRLIQANGRDGSLYARRGMALASLGQLEKALRAYEHAIACGASDPAAWENAALLRLHFGDVEGHRKLCAEALRRFGQHPDISVRFAVAWTCALSPIEAMRAGRLSDKLQADFVEYGRGMFESPEETDPNAFTSLMAQIFTLMRTTFALAYRAGKPETLLTGFEQLKDFQGDSALDWLLLAMAHHRLGHADDARKWLSAAVAWLDASTPEKPQNASLGAPVPWDRWLQVQLLRHEAEALIRGSPAWKDPKEGIAYARAHARLQQWQKAAADYDRVFQQMPADARSHAHGRPAAGFADARLRWERGRCYARLGKWKEAAADLTQAIEHYPEDALLYADRAQCYREMKETDKAAQDYGKASALMAKAVAAQRAALDRLPGLVELREELAESYRELADAQRLAGKPADAAATLLELRRLWPSHAGRLFETARELARCIPPAGEDQRRRLADQAMETLTQAVLAGYQDAAALKREPDFAPLRARPDFQALLGEPELPSRSAAAVGQIRQLPGHVGAGVESVAFAPDGRTAVSAGLDNRVFLWDVRTGKEVRRFEGHTAPAYGVALLPDGRRAVSSSSDGTVRVWDLEAGKELRRIQADCGQDQRLACSPNGRFVLCGATDGSLRLYDVETGQEVRRFDGHRQPVLCVAFSPDGTQALSGDREQTLRWWDVATGKELGRFDTLGPRDPHTGSEPGRLRASEAAVWCVAFTRDGKQAVSAHGDGFVRLWDLAAGKEVRRFAGHWNVVRAVALTPDGKRLLSGGQGGRLILWDLATGRELHRFAGARDTAGISVAPDGQTALTASPDTYLYLWDLSGDAARARDLARLGRLAEAEAAYARAVERRPRDLALRLDRARFHARQRQWDKAADDFAAVLQVQADQPQLWLECGRWNAEAGRWDRVAADFARALELVPEDINQFSQRNQIAVELAQWDQAFARAVELRPKDGMLWIGRGRYLGRRGRWKEAAEAYARVIATRPLERNEEWYEYACLLLLTGDTAGYRRFCQEQIARAGTVKDPFLAYVLARTCGQAPGAADPAQVVRWGEQAVRSERNAWFLHTLGLALYRAGQYEQAIKLLEESDRANWGQRTLLNWLALALAHHRLGHAAAARRWLDKATAELKRVRDAKPNELADFPITDWLEAEVLRREAEEGVGASSS